MNETGPDVGVDTNRMRPPQPPWLPIVLDYLEENGVDADSLLIQLGAANQLRVES